MTNGFRKRFTFWLNLDNDHEFDISETIESLKTRRLFSRTIRDGIRLLEDLRAGNTDVLFELFPELRRNLTPSPPDDDGLNELKNEIKMMRDLMMSSNVQSDYKMMETQQVPVAVIPPPKKKSVVVNEPPKDGKGDGSSANNLLASLANF